MKQLSAKEAVSYMANDANSLTWGAREENRIKAEFIAFKSKEKEMIALVPICFWVLWGHTTHGSYPPKEGCLSMEPDAGIQLR